MSTTALAIDHKKSVVAVISQSALGNVSMSLILSYVTDELHNYFFQKVFMCNKSNRIEDQTLIKTRPYIWNTVEILYPYRIFLINKTKLKKIQKNTKLWSSIHTLADTIQNKTMINLIL